MQVSWIRQRDLHILTAGLFTYTSDQRFSVVQRSLFDHSSSILDGVTSDWILQIKFVQPRDAGVYGETLSFCYAIYSFIKSHFFLVQNVKLVPSPVCLKIFTSVSLVRTISTLQRGCIF